METPADRAVPVAPDHDTGARHAMMELLRQNKEMISARSRPGREGDKEGEVGQGAARGAQDASHDDISPQEDSARSTADGRGEHLGGSSLETGRPESDGVIYGAQVDTFWVSTSAIMLCITYMLVLCVLGIVCWQFTMYPYEKHIIAWTIGAVFMMISVPLALQDIHFHIIHYCSPLQRHYIRILWMIPIYSVESWLALRFNEQKLYLETGREAYEAYVVYSFYKLMRDFLGDKPQALARLRRVRERTGRDKTRWYETPGACCCRDWRLDSQFLTRSSLGVYQYVFLRTVCALLGLILEQWHLFGEGHYEWDKFYVYYVIIVNLSQCWALWCLLVFYQIMKEDLKPLRPLPKFLVIKAVVFVSWWQGIIIMYMASREMLHPVLDYSSEDVAKGLQNLLICAEMLVYGLCFHYVFRYTDFKNDGALVDFLSEHKAVMKPPEDAVREMMPIDVLIEGKGYVDRVPKYMERNLPEGIKKLPGELAHGASALPGHLYDNAKQLPSHVSHAVVGVPQAVGRQLGTVANALPAALPAALPSALRMASPRAAPAPRAEDEALSAAMAGVTASGPEQLSELRLEEGAMPMFKPRELQVGRAGVGRAGEPVPAVPAADVARAPLGEPER